jgi:alpha-glucosidase
MKTIAKVLVLLLFVPVHSSAKSVYQKTYVVHSPSGNLTAVICDYGDTTKISIVGVKDTIIAPSSIFMQFDKNRSIGIRDKVRKSSFRDINEMVDAMFYRTKSFKSSCHEMTLKMKNGGVVVRAYDEGIAYRFFSDIKGKVKVLDEKADFHFNDDFISYLPYSTNDKNPFAMAFQNTYDVTPLSKAQNKLAFLPVTVDEGKVKVTLLESDLESYPGMFVRSDTMKTNLKGVFAPYPSRMDYYPWRHMSHVGAVTGYIADVNGSRTYPWRVFSVTADDRQMPLNNLVYALASKNRIGDTSWIRPGKVAWDWWNDWGLKNVPFVAGINTETYQYYIDFASKHGLEYVVLDEGWYDSKKGDMLTPIKDVDLPGLLSYAKQRNVGIILWCVFNVLDEQLDAACKKYADMGVKGFKVDFMDRDDQTATEMAYRIADRCAKSHLMLDYHGFYKPTGINRTYPNIVNIESVFGMEEAKWGSRDKDMPRYDVTFPFIRGMAGFADFTPGAFRNATAADYQPVYYHPMSQGTRCHQVAMYICYDSPLTMLSDSPSAYMADESCTHFIAGIPTDFDETRVLLAKLGEYLVVARRKGSIWYVGGMTNWTKRTLSIPLSFIGDKNSHHVTLCQDGVNSNKDATDYEIIEKTIDSSSSLTLTLASGGGFAAVIH